MKALLKKLFSLYFIFLSFLVSASINFAQTFNWAKHAGGTSNERGLSISTDTNGNSYVVGYFGGTAMFGTIQLVSYGDYDIFVAKYDANGNCMWAKSAGGTSSDWAYSISIDANGNSYVTGYFSGTVMFGTNQLVSYGGRDIFIARYDTNGECIWAEGAGGNGEDVGDGISTDTDGKFYVAGEFEGTVVFGTIQLVSYGGRDIFIAKYDSSGNCIWAKNAGGNDYDHGVISTDANGNSYVTGCFTGTATFGTLQIDSYGYTDIFIAKYDSSGNCIWVKNAGGNSTDNGYNISTDANGNSFITGNFDSTATFGTIQLFGYGNEDIFLAKYDSSGSCIWVKNAGGNSYDHGMDISIDANGNSFITGYFDSTATFGTIQLNGYGWRDIFIAKYNSSGNCEWAERCGGIGVDEGFGISTSTNGNSYITGGFNETATFGTIQLVSYGGRDIFITAISNVSSSNESLSSELIPSEILLHQNYPNPFNPSTKIGWQSPVGSHQSLKVFDVLGNEIATLVDEYKPAGNYEVEFNATYLPSGVYFYQLKATPNGGQAGGYLETKKMILLK